MVYLGTNSVNVADLITTTDSINSLQAVIAVTAPSGTPLLLTNNNITLIPTVRTNAEDSNYNCSLFTIPSNLFNSQKWEIINNNREKISLVPPVLSAKYYNILIQTFSSFMSNDYIGKIYLGTEFIGGVKSIISNNFIDNSSAIIGITIPTIVPISLTNGTTVLNPVSWTTYENDNFNCSLFIVPSNLFDSQNEWGVIDTDGYKINSNTIIISSPKYYEFLYNILPLYSDGNEYDDITDGWYTRANSALQSDRIKVQAAAGDVNPYTGQVMINNGVATPYKDIDVTNYNTLHAIVSPNGVAATIGIGGTRANGTFTHSTKTSNTYDEKIEITVNISEVQGEQIIKIVSANTGRAFYVHKVWLD